MTLDNSLVLVNRSGNILDRGKEKFLNRRLKDIQPGLVKLKYQEMGEPQEELALIMTPELADSVLLPNNMLQYREFIRSITKSYREEFSAGPFSGYIILDEQIKDISRRVIELNDSFGDFDNNYYPLLIACNHPHFKAAILELKDVISKNGFNVDSSNWEGFKRWEMQLLKEFEK